MIAKRRGSAYVELYVNEGRLRSEDPVALIHIDEFEDLFGKEITDWVKRSPDVKIVARIP